MSGRNIFIGLIVLITALGPAISGHAASSGPDTQKAPVSMAVEFMDHAAAAFVCLEKGWFDAAGLDVKSYETYVTGMALASALARGDIDAAFICLIPAINAYSNAGVPISIIAGTHKHGYGLVARRAVVAGVKDLEKAGVRLGCVREGGAVDVLLNKAMDVYRLDKITISSRLQRMSPARQVMAIHTNQLDAAVLPEQWATMAESADGCRMLFTSQDVWPDMQGSVLVVKKTMIQKRPDAARKLIAALKKATAWINQHPRQAADVVSRQLQRAEGGKIQDVSAAGPAAITPEVLARSMDRLNYTTNIDPGAVQATIDFMAELGYIKKAFKAGDLLDLRFLKEAR
ncbi:MAG: ABC transporter substrate-binding protein [Thermodesulfobacteriota bacterium]|nr:ABC transporter substrate-binding protein [Thermodesulfobacteriota bacterium]